MKNDSLRVLVVLGMMFVLASASANASSCSLASTAGNWAYTYTGTIFTQNGPLPAASVGHYHEDAAGNISGSQTRTVAGNSGVEDISGSISVNKNCTATMTIDVLVNGQLQRRSVLVRVYDTNQNHGRAIFQSLTLPDGTNVPVVLTADANTMFFQED